MLPEQRAYIHAFVDGVVKGGYGAGVYCSGIACSRVEQSFGDYGQRHSRQRWRPRNSFLHQQRPMRAFAGLRFSQHRAAPLPRRVVFRSPKSGSMRNLHDVLS